VVGAVLVAAAAAFVGGDPQVQYDYARDLEESVAGRVDVCATTTRVYARALVREAEGVDRLKPSLARAAGVRAVAAKKRVRSGCERELAPTVTDLEQPRSGEVSFGTVVVRVPPGATGVDVTANRRLVFQKHKVGQGRLVVTLDVPPGRYTLRAKFLPRGEQVSRGVWFVSARADDVVFATHRADAGIERAGSAFRGWAGIWTHDLRTGRATGWNETAAFPAASTVKLGVLAAALRNYGAPSVVSYDLFALTSWSSNLAANRLYRLLGSSRVRDGLLALGMDASTYTGEYRIGTALGPPPRVSGRVTTARDLGRALFRLHAAALGHRFALERTKLSRHEARVALGYLLSFDRTDANRGLLPLRAPTAEKNGWLNDALHTAAIVYAPSGPKIVVVLTYRSGLRGSEARALGARVYKVANAS
jgi:hypothetical protein